MIAQLLDSVHILDTPQNIDAAYAAEVDWAQGYRLNPDSRLLLLGASRLIARLRHGEEGANGNLDKFRTALVLGSDFGSLSSYEVFHDSIIAAEAPRPLGGATARLDVAVSAAVHAMPSIPTAALSIRFGFHGPTITVSGEAEVGVMALRTALMLLAQGRCDTALAGCWHMPSATTARAGLPASAQLLLIALRRCAGRARPEDFPTWSEHRQGRSCVDVLAAWLALNRSAFEREFEPMMGVKSG